MKDTENVLSLKKEEKLAHPKSNRSSPGADLATDCENKEPDRYGGRSGAN